MSKKSGIPSSVDGVAKESGDAPPPILGEWKYLYTAVLAITLAVYGLLALFSSYAR